ncbi:phosphoribosylaminoimidazolecarboxamide formyltransferase/IMP cyclohydrolase [Anseongella ginsenosidimutans]|uniref:Bifunctional purine biosynthesis protein PurH n=1 Tax=Anseongella ginsenosidimutans TaxID=496056 RepID=A0A4V2UUD6_9SPHI|nr:bifunctional phosphoribosylaminoimidazolecarboxamide formyltransferase/IMP cyclohydrolase [Anseongella ginsenosidimutans]QEC51059.1 bifunctional phosphoribosylaminoimidazolecarboxamide formyltransferase/IMP cyclohydrolase [Anseongella ginsenosidimutans]TCS90283.1 phosphoribosylaminoimidazolecarboxamide formyltransferase/IMP cyclohydrolase [Anseongella ginsenosidimutans]
MNHPVKIKSALISVYYKDNLDPLIHLLKDMGVTIYSTGGTEQFIRDLGAEVQPVEGLTSYPSILGGRVKTLHPKIFGGILARRDHAGDLEQLKQYDIPPVDLVIVDLYPFEETVASGAAEEEIIEKIDIGGISLIRAAAKNYRDVAIIASRNEYSHVEKLLREQNGDLSLEQRRELAKRAFNTSSHYDTAIFHYFNRKNPLPVFKESLQASQTLRYGENPHQQGTFYGKLDDMFLKLGGKELSYNNLVDVDAAVALMAEFSNDDPTFAILKHNNACGAATRETLAEAWKDALACDPVSAFGGILICNRAVDAETASAISELFYEVLIAPSYEENALEILRSKKNRIILRQRDIELPSRQFRSLLNGIIEQDKDLSIEGPEQMKTVTLKSPSAAELNDLFFANKLVKHTKSNTIVLVKGNSLLASGVGQTSRVDALKQAIVKAGAFGFDLEGAVMASDAFFPFPDCVEIAHEAGITAVLQPGGSIRDQDSIDLCNKTGLAMVVTGIRHFKH